MTRGLSHRFQSKPILQKAHYNVHMIPPEFVPFDFSTDSLQHHFYSVKHSRTTTEPLKSIAGECEEEITKIFGFPFAIPVSQGRLAEAVVSKLLIHKGTVVPTNTPFATTKLHQELN